MRKNYFKSYLTKTFYSVLYWKDKDATNGNALLGMLTSNNGLGGASKNLVKCTHRQPKHDYFKCLVLPILCLSPLVYAETTPHEPNNTPADAVFLYVNSGAQTYKFDYSGDEDWFVFYAKKGVPYDIEIPTKSVGKGINPAIELYNNKGSVEVGLFDFNFSGEGELLSLHSLPKDGFYYLRITNLQKTFSIDGHYDLKVYQPFLFNNLVVKGRVIDQCTQQGLDNVAIDTAGDPGNVTRKGVFALNLQLGSTHSVTANLEGYTQQSKMVFSEKKDQNQELSTNTDLQFELTPTVGCQTPDPVPYNPSNGTEPNNQPIPPPPPPVAVFNELNGELFVKEVRVGDGLISAKLARRNDARFKLIEVLPLNNATYNTPAFYDYDTFLADIPRVTAYGKTYRIQLKNIAGNDYVFELLGIPIELP